MRHSPTETALGNPHAALRKLAAGAPPRNQEQCDLCGAGIDPDHRHVIDLAARQILCACRACALLFDRPADQSVRRLVPTRRLWLTRFEMPDTEWDGLQIPVDVAFFCGSAAPPRITAHYPSPAGPTESLLPLATWDAVALRNPVLRQMAPDVEALLANRRRGAADYFLVPIDDCYRLVGLIRLHWRGFGGGQEVQEQIEQFFDDLKDRATAIGDAHA